MAVFDFNPDSLRVSANSQALECREVTLQGLYPQGFKVLFCGGRVGDEQKKWIAEILSTFPIPLLNKIAVRNVVQIFVTEGEGDARLELSQPGQIFLRGEFDPEENRVEIVRLTDELRKTLGQGGVEERSTFSRKGRLLIPPDFALAARTVVRQFASQGLVYHPSSILRAELGLVDSVSDDGKSSHKVRLRTTNPAFNRWVYHLFIDPLVPVDPGLEIYAGVFSTVATNPFALLGIFAWGADAELTDLKGNAIFLDTNIQHRVRSSGSSPSDQLVLEWAPRIESSDGQASLGVSLSVALLPEPDLDAALVGRIVFDESSF